MPQLKIRGKSNLSVAGNPARESAREEGQGGQGGQGVTGAERFKVALLCRQNMPP